MYLLEFEHVQAQKLSGGNKRKLSVAMALLGSPPVILLDEPSNGVDPKAKRFMWGIIAKLSQGRGESAVVLTTHSMEEAEALSTKMGILVDGVFRCFGSPQDIRDRLGMGYEIELKVQWPSREEAFALMQKSNRFINKRVVREQRAVGKDEKDEEVNSQNVKEFLARYGWSALYDELNEHGSGASEHAIFSQGKDCLVTCEGGSMQPIDLAKWAMVEMAGKEV